MVLLENFDAQQKGDDSVESLNVLLPSVYQETPEHINDVKQYVVDIVKHIDDILMYIEHIDVDNLEAEWEERKAELLHIGMVPSSIERIEQYFNRNACYPISMDSINVSAITCNKTQLYHYKGTNIIMVTLKVSIYYLVDRLYHYIILNFIR